MIWSREKRSRPPNRETRVACWSSTLTAGFGFAAFVSVFVRVAAGLLARVSVLTGVASVLTVTLVGLLALRVVAAGRARFSVLGVLAIVGILRAARLGADLNVTIFERLNGLVGEELRPNMRRPKAKV